MKINHDRVLRIFLAIAVLGVIITFTTKEELASASGGTADSYATPPPPPPTPAPTPTPLPTKLRGH